MSTENTLHTGPFTIVHDEIVADVGADAALIFGKMLGWFQPNKHSRSKLRVTKEEELWLAKSCPDIAQECHLKLKQVRTAIDTLVEANYLVKKVFLYNKLRTNHFQLGEKGRPFCFFTEPHKKGSKIRGNKYPVNVATTATYGAPGTCANKVTPNAIEEPTSALFGVPITVDNAVDEIKEYATSNCIQITGIIAKEMPEDSSSPFFLSGEETEEEQHSKRLEWEEQERLRTQVKVPVVVQVQAPIPVQPPPPLPPQVTGFGNRAGVQVLPMPSYPGVAGPGGLPRQYAHQSHKPYRPEGWEEEYARAKVPSGELSRLLDLVQKRVVRSERELQEAFVVRRPGTTAQEQRV